MRKKIVENFVNESLKKYDDLVRKDYANLDNLVLSIENSVRKIKADFLEKGNHMGALSTKARSIEEAKKLVATLIFYSDLMEEYIAKELGYENAEERNERF